MTPTLSTPPPAPGSSQTPVSPNSSSGLNSVCRELERLRGRLKRLYVAHGLVRLGLELSAILVVAFLADRLFETPREARIVQLFVVVALIGWRVWSLIVYPLTRKVRLRDLAMAVERRYPVLDGRLISALDLGRREITESQNISPVLVNRLVDETLELRKELEFGGIFEFRSLSRFSAGLLASVALVVTFAAIYPVQASVFASRFLGGSRPWPRSTNLILDIPDDSPNYSVVHRDVGPGLQDIHVVIAKGASLPVVVDVDGRMPDSINLIMDEDGGARRDLSMRSRGENEFFYRLRSLRRDTTLSVEGGDDRGEGRRITVTVRTPPTLSGVSARLTPPAYTGLLPTEQATGHIDAPVGTRVDLILDFNVPVSKARLAFDGQIDLAKDLAETEDLTQRTASFFVEKSGSYALDLRGEDGFPNLDPISFTVVAVEDKEPVVRTVFPDRPSIDVTPKALILFRTSGLDDYGVSAVHFAYKVLGAEMPVEQPLTTEQLTSPLPSRDFDGALLWDCSQLQVQVGEVTRALEPGDSLEYYWAVQDNAVAYDPIQGEGQPSEHVVTSNLRRIEIVSEAEKQRLLTERQVRLKTDTNRLRSEHRENVEWLKSFMEVHDGGAGGFEQSDLVRIEIAQNRVTQRAGRLTSDFASIFEEYLYNRLDRSSSAERLLDVHLAMKSDAPLSEGFDVGLFIPRLEEFRRGDYGDMEILSRLLTMLDLIVQISERLSPEAYGLLSQARVTSDQAKKPELLAEAVKLQALTLAAFDDLISRMDDWEGFQEMLEALQDIITDYKRIGTRYGEELKGDNKEGSDR